MENWWYSEIQILWKVIFSIAIIFAAIIIITKIFGLRTFAKMSSFDFASTIAIGSILANVIMNTNQSITKGIVALIGIIIFQFSFTYAVRKSAKFKSLFTNKSQLLMWKGEILEDQLKKCNVEIGDLIAKLREANVHHLNEVQAVIFESTGDISVLHHKDKKDIQDVILTGISMEPIQSTGTL